MTRFMQQEPEKKTAHLDCHGSGEPPLYVPKAENDIIQTHSLALPPAVYRLVSIGWTSRIPNSNSFLMMIAL